MVDSFAVGLGAVAEAWVDHRETRPDTHAARCEGMCWPRERPDGRRGSEHEEVFVWGILLRLDWEPLRRHGLTTGVVRHACRLRRDGTRGFNFLFRGFFCGWTGSREGMCWPRERQHEGLGGIGGFAVGLGAVAGAWLREGMPPGGTRRFLVSHARERSFGAVAPRERRDED